MTPRRLDSQRLDRELDELGVSSTPETRKLLDLLATDPHALYVCLSRLSQLEFDAAQLPAVDELVAHHFKSGFPDCTEPQILRKSKPMGSQSRRLLGVLLRDVSTPVPLPELLLANALRSGTPRRLRELQMEHGAFQIRTFSRDRVQHYLLEHPDPDVATCCRYWIRANLRDSRLGPERRVLALLSSQLDTFFSLRELDYILPEKVSPGFGQARGGSGRSAETLSELAQRGHDLETAEHGVRLRTLIIRQVR
jgi:hypothetical protein